MRIVCPQCGYSREIPGDKIPAHSSIATCPKCQFRFRFRADLAPQRIEPVMVEEPVYPPRPSRPTPRQEPVRDETAIPPFSPRTVRTYDPDAGQLPHRESHTAHMARSTARWLPDAEPEGPVQAAPRAARGATPEYSGQPEYAEKHDVYGQPGQGGLEYEPPTSRHDVPPQSQSRGQAVPVYEDEHDGPPYDDHGDTPAGDAAPGASSGQDGSPRIPLRQAPVRERGVRASALQWGDGGNAAGPLDPIASLYADDVSPAARNARSAPIGYATEPDAPETGAATRTVAAAERDEAESAGAPWATLGPKGEASAERGAQTGHSEPAEPAQRAEPAEPVVPATPAPPAEPDFWESSRLTPEAFARLSGSHRGASSQAGADDTLPPEYAIPVKGSSADGQAGGPVPGDAALDDEAPQATEATAGNDSVRDIWARLQSMGSKDATSGRPAKDAPPGAPRRSPPPGGETVVPWEQLEYFGVVPAFLNTLKNILLKPGDFFVGLPASGGLARSLIFSMVVCEVAALSCLIWNFFGLGPNFAELGRTEWFQGLGSGSLGGLALLGLAPMLLVVSVSLDAALSHLLLGLLRGASKPLADTFKTVCYSGGPWILAALPMPFAYLIPVVLIWHMTLQAIGLKKLHQAGYPQVLAAVLVKWSLFFMGSFAVLHMLFTRH